MADYTRLEINDIYHISQHYGLVVTDFEALAGGAANSSYRLQTISGDYVLTVFDSQPVQDVVCLSKLLSWLVSHDIPTSIPILQVNGDTVLVYHGLALVLKQYIFGAVARDLHPSMMLQVGQVMAQLHQIPVPNFLPDNALYGMTAYNEFKGLQVAPTYETWLTQEIALILKQLLAVDLPRGLIHGDLFTDNVLFHGHKLQAIIDFEVACNYYLIFDLGMSIVGMCYTDGLINWQHVQALLAGYESVRKFAQSEKNLLQTCVQYAAITTSCWRFWQYQIHRPDSAKVDKYLEMVHIAKQIAAISSDDFLQNSFGA